MKKLLLLFFLLLGCHSTNNLNFPPAQHFNTLNETQWEIVSLKVINLTNQETEVRNYLKGYFNPYPVSTPLGLSNYIYASIKYKKDRICLFSWVKNCSGIFICSIIEVIGRKKWL